MWLDQLLCGWVEIAPPPPLRSPSMSRHQGRPRGHPRGDIALVQDKDVVDRLRGEVRPRAAATRAPRQRVGRMGSWPDHAVVLHHAVLEMLEDVAVEHPQARCILGERASASGPTEG